MEWQFVGGGILVLTGDIHRHGTADPVRARRRIAALPLDDPGLQYVADQCGADAVARVGGLHPSRGAAVRLPRRAGWAFANRTAPVSHDASRCADDRLGRLRQRGRLRRFRSDLRIEHDRSAHHRQRRPAGDAAARLRQAHRLRRDRGRWHLERAHSPEPHPALLRHRHRGLDRPALHCRGDSGPHSDRVLRRRDPGLAGVSAERHPGVGSRRQVADQGHAWSLWRRSW